MSVKKENKKERISVTKQDLVKFIAKGAEAKIESITLFWNSEILRMVGVEEYGETCFDRASFFKALIELSMDNFTISTLLKVSVPIIMFKHKINGKNDLVAVGLILNNADGIDYAVLEYVDLPQEFKDKVLELTSNSK